MNVDQGYATDGTLDPKLCPFKFLLFQGQLYVTKSFL